MTPESILSGLIGAGLMGLLAVISMISYRRTLLSCARQQSAERLMDGKFYYLVPEARYNELLAIERETKFYNSVRVREPAHIDNPHDVTTTQVSASHQAPRQQGEPA